MNFTRPINHNERVEIYWNLHKRVYSVRALTGIDRGRVIAHVDAFALSNVMFVVNKAGRAKVLAERRKNVHAFVRGIWKDEPVTAQTDAPTAYYNPYSGDTFMSEGSPLTEAPYCVGRLRSDDKGTHPFMYLPQKSSAEVA